jgi:rhamnose utilization protein RhaD (predicted bifunctional aldolase and dehydrogenase)
MSKVGDLILLANSLGAHGGRPTLWNEGSCAVKTGPDTMLVTRRGAHLAELAEADIVELNLPRLIELSAQENTPAEAVAELFAEAAVEPSMEALTHAYVLSFDGTTVSAHTQPVEVNQILCSPRARQFAERRTNPNEVLGCGASSLLVPYADPGLPLTREVRRKMALWRDRFKTPPRLVLLQNHGMIVLGGTVAEVLRTIDMTIKAAQIFIGAAAMGGPVFLTPTNVTRIEEIGEL